MEIEERKKLIESSTPTIEAIHHGDCYVDWGWRGRGFGQLNFRFDKETGKIHVANECMSRETVRKILVALANHIADNAILDDER